MSSLLWMTLTALDVRNSCSITKCAMLVYLQKSKLFQLLNQYYDDLFHWDLQAAVTADKSSKGII